MDRIDTFDKETIAAMAEAILLLPDKLPDGIEDALVTLRHMLEKAVQGVEDAVPQPPSYGKVAAPATAEDDNNILHLRPDVAAAETKRLIELSPRRDGDYITVPRVVGSAPDQTTQPGGHHA